MKSLIITVILPPVGCGAALASKEVSLKDQERLSKLASLCGIQKIIPDTRINHGVGPEFQKYVNLYESATGRQVRDVPIGFGPVKDFKAGDVAATCVFAADGRSEILVDRAIWSGCYDKKCNNIKPFQKEAMILHELAHCVQFRPHRNDVHEVVFSSSKEMTGVEAGQPVEIYGSVMNQFLIEVGYEFFRSYYLRELSGEQVSFPERR